MNRKTEYKVAGIGELLWDILPYGKQLGCAPCNFAYHALQSGCDGYVVSAIGKDKDGDEILSLINSLGLNKDYIQQSSEFPTETVTVKLDNKGIPDYTIHMGVAWDNISWTDGIKNFINVPAELLKSIIE